MFSRSSHKNFTVAKTSFNECKYTLFHIHIKMWKAKITTRFYKTYNLYYYYLFYYYFVIYFLTFFSIKVVSGNL